MSNNPLIDNTKFQRVQNTYIILAFQLLITILTVYYIRQTPSLQSQLQTWFWIPVILSFVLLFWMMYIHRTGTLNTRLVLFSLFSICLGTICIASTKYVSADVIQTSLQGVLIIFVVMSIVGYVLYKQNISLEPLQLLLIFVLLGLIVGWLVAIFSRVSSQMIRTMFIIGFVVFTLLIGVDTNRMLMQPVWKADSVHDAMSLYLDLMNLFQQLVGLQQR